MEAKVYFAIFYVFLKVGCYAQAPSDLDIFINAYLQKDTVFFVDTLIVKQQSLKEDRVAFNKIRSKKILTFRKDTSETIVFLAQDGNLFFIKPSKATVTITQRLSMVQIDSFGSRMFPSDIMKVNIDQDKNEELLLKYTEAGEPPALFKIAILSLDEEAKFLTETEPLFPFPSYNPFIEPKSVQIRKDKIVIPYCLGCESGREGKEAEGVITYNRGSYVFKK